MSDSQLVSTADQLTAAIRDIVKEKGYNVDVTIAVEVDGGMVFEMGSRDVLSPEQIKAITDEAILRIGGTF